MHWHSLASVAKNEEADAFERPQEFEHVGLLFNEPPGITELLFS